MKIELTYEQQQQVLANNIWFDILITFWNEDNDKIKEVSFTTQYPNACDIDQTLQQNGLIKNCKDYDGDFDYYEVSKIRPDHKAMFILDFENIEINL